jgi:CpeT/CpcT family (DUF1001)
MHFTWAVIALLSLVGCADTPREPDRNDDLGELSGLLVGDYFSAADGGVREGRPIYMRIRSIDSPLKGSVALFAEMRHDGREGELYRQRVYLFDRGQAVPITMRALVFDDPVAASGLVDDPTLWVRKGLSTRPALPDGCDTRWIRQHSGFLGSVDPATCVITGKRGDQRRIESKTLITPESIGQLERGFDMDGKLLFGQSKDEFYVWPRMR